LTRPLVTTAAAVLGLALAAPVAAQDPVDHGRRLAERWCGACHMLPGESRGSDAAPPLARVVAGREVNRGALEAWLSTPHPTMPDMCLTRAEIDALIAYLRAVNP